MARHRSPRGRRAHLRFPLPALVPAAGAGGAGRSVPVELAAPSLRAVVATAVAGSVAAAAGQAALVGALPAVADGATALRSGVPALASLGTAPASAAAPVVLPSVAPVVPEPVVADAAALVKGAELARAAEERAAEAARAAQARRGSEAERAAAEKRAAAERRAAGQKAVASTAGGAVQMVVGRVTSGFGARWGGQHTGLDIAARIGTPIRVPLGGTVTDSGPANGFGQWVRVRHDDGTMTVYGHINRSYVGAGDRVSAGDTIAEVGNRGRSTGPHLHFEVITGGKKIDPRPWLDERGIGY